MPKDVLGHGSNPRGVNIAGGHLPVWYHGSPMGYPHSVGPIHVGSKLAAKQALEARIGIPADGQGWNGDREYGKTLLAGKDTLLKMDPRGYNLTGFNVDAPQEDYYPKAGSAKFGDGTPVPMSAKPAVRAYQIVGHMSNRPEIAYTDAVANGMASAQQKRGGGKSGFFYKNVGEDEGSISAVVPSRNHLSGFMG